MLRKSSRTTNAVLTASFLRCSATQTLITATTLTHHYEDIHTNTNPLFNSTTSATMTQTSSFSTFRSHQCQHMFSMATLLLNKNSTPTTLDTSTMQVNRRYFATFRHKRPNSKQRAPIRNLPLRNEEITAPELRIVYPEAEEKPTETMSLSSALAAARERNLDLVMASPNAKPPVARLIEWDKIIYLLRQKQKAAEKAARENKKLSAPKEMRIGCHIATHDLGIKLESMRKFLGDGHTVRLMVTFKGGREVLPARNRLGEILDILGDVAVVKDPRHLLKPQMNQWAVQLSPVAAAAPNGKQ